VSGCDGSASKRFKRAFQVDVAAKRYRLQHVHFMRTSDVPAVTVLLFRSFTRVLHVSCFLLQVLCNRGAGVACACATAIAILPPPSEKMAKWELDKSFQNDKTRA